MSTTRRSPASVVTFLVSAAAIALLTPVGAQVQPRLVQPSSLVHLGSFTLPGGLADMGFEYGGTALAYNPAHDSLFIVGHDWLQLMAEVTIPAIGGTATVLQALADPSEGVGVGASVGETKIGGSLVYDGSIWFTKYIYYDAAYAQTASHFRRPLSLSTTGQVFGPQTIGTLGAGFVSGYLGRIPSEWQSTLGGTVLTGNCCLSIISRTSYGPAVSSWTPGQTSANPLVYYTVDHQTLGTYGAPGSHPDFNGTTRIKGIAFPEGTDSVLFFGRTGTGPYCYGTGAECGDPIDDSRGEHAYPYRMYVWAYNAYDLAAVRNGTRQPWDVTPYRIWDLGIEANNEFSSHTAYDPATGRIFVSQVLGNGDLPLIHVFSVAAAPPLPTLTSSPAAVNIGAVNTGGVLTSVTPAQTVTVSQSGGTGVAWTASADVSWLTIAAADAVGNGTGTFTVTLNNTGNVLPAAGIVNGTITITAPGAASNPTIPVTATLYAPGGTLPPFGLTSSPDQNAAGVQGAVGITGWVLDDVGIERVRLYRNCLGFEDQNACQVVAGQSVVWMGDATLVAGARPDIEGAYPAYPQHNRAGFGYAMLSNLSPHIPNQAMFGGQGPLTIFIRARDIEGNEAWVGRNFVGGSTTLSDEVPTAITMANDTIAKPFGTIDTPTQGQTVGGALWNWGWALTPDSNAIAGDAGDILIPTTGTTITVWIDGAARGTVTYNQCRGVMAPYCIDDIASIFGNQIPRPIGTPRANNPTVFRNLDANRGAIGGFFLDTAAYTNAVHTIAWAAYDNAAPARGDGLGSRYFTVLNTGTDADRRQATGDRRQGEDRDLGSGASSVTLARRDTTDPRSPIPDPRSPAEVRGRTGFSLDAPYVVLVPDAEGVRHVQMAEMGRLELQFTGLVESGYLVVNNAYRALPVGSQFDAATGTFTWAPGVGFIGTYRLAFEDSRSRAGVVPKFRRTTPALERESVAAGDRAVSGPRSRVPNPDAVLVLVNVTIRPATPPAPGDAALRMHLDTPQPGATVSGSFLVAGWALDPHAAIGSGIGAVHVWAQRTDVPGESPIFLGAATLDGARSDVGGIFGAQFSSAGFNLAVPVLAPGTYDVTAYIWNTRTARWEDARTVSVIVR